MAKEIVLEALAAHLARISERIEKDRFAHDQALCVPWARALTS
jgi:hypothetical protein